MQVWILIWAVCLALGCYGSVSLSINMGPVASTLWMADHAIYIFLLLKWSSGLELRGFCSLIQCQLHRSPQLPRFIPKAMRVKSLSRLE